MKTTVPRTGKDAQNPARSFHRTLAGPHSGRLAQLAAMMNQSPQVQAQLKLRDEIQSSERVQSQIALAAEINQAPVAQPRLREEDDPAQREATPNRTGLPDQLKAGVENLSGISLNDVKVHYNSAKPAQLNALAYAQGTDIHVAPGQEKHLPHEAWHIVQQAQGRVKPTMQMKAGTPVNDDPHLEHEADVMGARAPGHGATLVQRASQSELGPGSAPGPFPVEQDETPIKAGRAPTVQPKMGFEFETAYTFEIWKGEEWKAVGRTKDDPFYKGDGFSIEGDTHDNCEFILDPFESKAGAVAATSAAAKLTGDIDKEFAKDAAKEKHAVYEAGGNWKKKTRIADNSNQWKADAQVTQGVKLADLPQYIRDHLNREELEGHEQLVEGAGLDEVDPEVRGLVELIIQFVVTFKDWDGADADEGPKNAQVWMARTRYSDMAKALGKKLAAFKALFFDEETWKKGNPITEATGVKGGDRIIPNRYIIPEKDADDEYKTTGSTTTLKQWITELCEEVDQDSMSPPKGWAGGNYGMGLKGMDEESAKDPLVLLEYRKTDNRDEMDETSGKDLPSPSWADYVKEQFDKALKWNATLKKR